MFEFPDGKVREVEVFHIPDTDVTGAVLGAFVITHDVTQHNLATRELAESRKLLQETIDAAPVSISIKDLHFHDLRHEAISRFFEELYAEVGDGVMG